MFIPDLIKTFGYQILMGEIVYFDYKHRCFFFKTYIFVNRICIAIAARILNTMNSESIFDMWNTKMEWHSRGVSVRIFPIQIRKLEEIFF